MSCEYDIKDLFIAIFDQETCNEAKDTDQQLH